MSISHPFESRSAAGQVHLRILETTDLHAYLCAYDYDRDRPNDRVGLVRTASLIRQARAEARDCLLFDNGDLLQGNPLGDYVARIKGLREDETHPIIAAMNALGYDAATLGNHDFNFGLDFALQAIRGAAFPFVLGNVLATTPPGSGLLPPYALLDRQVTDGAGQRHDLRIGVLGLTPPQILRWDRSLLQGRITTLGFVETAQALIPRMRDEGADVVVVLAHTGISTDGAAMADENAAVALSRIEGVDVLLTGHVHQVFPAPELARIPGADITRGTLNGRATVMAGHWGSHLGIVDLLLEQTGDGWQVSQSQAVVRPISERRANGMRIALVPDDPEIAALACPAHLETLEHIRKPVGYSATPLHSYFSMVAGSAQRSLLAEAKLDLVHSMLPKGRYANLPVLASTTLFKTGGLGGPDYFTEVPAGDLTIRSVADLYLYPNFFRAALLTGAQLREWLERACIVFNRIGPGMQDAVLVDPDVPAYYFDVILGLTYDIDLAQPNRYDLAGSLVQPQARRIVNLRHEGRPLLDDARFVVAANSYRLDGGGGFPGLSDCEVVLETQDNNRDVLLNYIRHKGTVAPTPDTTWRFAPNPGSSVLFQTNPRARDFTADLQGLRVDDLGDDLEGFATFRLHL